MRPYQRALRALPAVLATAILPRLSASAAAHDDEALARTLVGTIRMALVVAVPQLLPVLAQRARVAFHSRSHSRSSGTNTCAMSNPVVEQ